MIKPLTIAFALAAICPAQRNFTLPDLVGLADVVFHGRVLTLHNEELADKGMAFTHVTFAVDRVIVDRTAKPIAGRIELVFAGGRLGEETVRVSGVPQFAVGDEVVAFAQHDGRRYATPILGGEAGVFRVVRDTATGVPYPLLAGRRGIAGIPAGTIEPADRVEAIRQGVVSWKEPEPMPGLVRVGAPRPKIEAGAVDAQVAVRARVRPDRLATLQDLVDAVCALHLLAPEGSDERRTGR